MKPILTGLARLLGQTSVHDADDATIARECLDEIAREKIWAYE